MKTDRLSPWLLGAALACSAGLSAAAEHAGYPLQQTLATGGQGTVKQADTNAYSLPQANLSMSKRLDFNVGNSFFRNPWVEAPASTHARDGLGPLFNTNSCQGCHIKDGRGSVPNLDSRPVSLFLRLAIDSELAPDPETLKRTGHIPHPVYGSQLQNSALPHGRPEADLSVSWNTQTTRLSDGTVVALRAPEYHISDPGYGPFGDALLTSARLAPPVTGMGLLEAIPQDALNALADPDDRDGDGISGRVNQVWSRETQQTVPGRFGWKAGEPSVLQQSMGAFAGDMGLTSSLMPTTDCTEAQACDRFPSGGTLEVSDKIADFVHFYVNRLAVPARRGMTREPVRRGARHFNELNCAACHTPRHVTRDTPEQLEFNRQVIWPYTDLLLHDMGPDLADGRPEFLANGREWRTPPLWGIGMAQVVNPESGFLHDGRARTLEEAILWHGGEAAAAAQGYRDLSAAERNQLIEFLGSL